MGLVHAAHEKRIICCTLVELLSEHRANRAHSFRFSCRTAGLCGASRRAAQTGLRWLLVPLHRLALWLLAWTQRLMPQPPAQQTDSAPDSAAPAAAPDVPALEAPPPALPASGDAVPAAAALADPPAAPSQPAAVGLAPPHTCAACGAASRPDGRRLL